MRNFSQGGSSLKKQLKVRSLYLEPSYKQVIPYFQKPEKRPWDVSTVVVQDVILLVVEVVKVDATELAKMLAMDVSTHAKEHVKTPVLELVNIQVVDSYCVNEVVPVFLT